jgi:hypothetical protein
MQSSMGRRHELAGSGLWLEISKFYYILTQQDCLRQRILDDYCSHV